MKALEKDYLDAVQKHVVELADRCDKIVDSVEVIDHSTTVVKGTASDITIAGDKFTFKIKPTHADLNKVDDHEYRVCNRVMRSALVSASIYGRLIEFTIQNNEIVQIKL